MFGLSCSGAGLPLIERYESVAVASDARSKFAAPGPLSRISSPSIPVSVPFAKVNGDHLVAESMSGVYQVAPVGQQDEIPDDLAFRDRPISVRHVPERLNCGAVEDRKPGSSDHRVRTVVLQRRPVENQIFAGPWCQGREIGEIRPSGRDDDRDRPQKGNARDADNQNQCPPLFTQ